MSTPAVATAVLTDERNTWVSGNKYFAAGTFSISADPAVYVTGGIAASLFLPLIKATFTPLLVWVEGQGSGTSGKLFVYRYIPGADASLGLLKILEQDGSTGGLVEIGESAIPADVSTDTISFYAIFNGML